MTNEQILQKAIEKAVENGYEFGKVLLKDPEVVGTFMEWREYYRIIFHLDFAKAFWGEEEITIARDDALVVGGNVDELGKNTTVEIQLLAWQHYLQQLVLEEEPLKYLAKFL